MWDEYGICRWNLRRGIQAGFTGIFENHFHSGMGSPIRSEIWACLFAGDPQSAAHYAAMDASLDHGREGIAGEVLFAVMQSLVATGADLESAIAQGAELLPVDCETAMSVRFVRDAFANGIEAWDCWKELLAHHENENFTHTPLNVALTIWALLYGGEDFEKSILLAVNGGYDTDCTAATVGATLGLISGAESIPARWSEPLGDGVFVGAGIRGINAPPTLGELTRRTANLIGKLPTQPWSDEHWNPFCPDVALTALQGTIFLTPFRSQQPVPWANSELPRVVKQQGGAEWIWETTAAEAREILCLARQGARLFVDGKLIHECPPGLPYVPAPHRCPKGSRVHINPSVGKHTVRVELTSNAAEQEASIILTYPNFHLCPWTRAELPSRAILP
jgi:hypothetical protein